MPCLSVAMATYNGSQYIREQLDSLAQQTYLPYELVVTDDGSTDDTCDQIRAFAETAPFKVVLHQNDRTLGYGQNFAKAIALTSGKIVFTCDQDDVWMPEKLEVMVQALEEAPFAAVVLCDTLLCDQNLVPSGDTKLGRIRANNLQTTSHVMGCCCALRREYLDSALPLPMDVRGHDNWLVQMADELGLTVRLSRPLQYYRLHGKNTSNFFINSVHQQNIFSRKSKKFRSLFSRFFEAGGMLDEHAMQRALLAHITSRESEFAALTGSETFNEKATSLRKRHEVLTRRVAIRRTPRIYRAGPITSLWSSGGYRGEGGLVAAVKDFVAAGRVLE